MLGIVNSKLLECVHLRLFILLSDQSAHSKGQFQANFHLGIHSEHLNPKCVLHAPMASMKNLNSDSFVSNNSTRKIYIFVYCTCFTDVRIFSKLIFLASSKRVSSSSWRMFTRLLHSSTSTVSGWVAWIVWKFHQN